VHVAWRANDGKAMRAEMLAQVLPLAAERAGALHANASLQASQRP
jgi:hypothetical protein